MSTYVGPITNGVIDCVIKEIKKKIPTYVASF